MIAPMSRRANSEAEVGPAAIAIAVVIGLLYLYLYLGGALLSGHSPTTGAGLGRLTHAALPAQPGQAALSDIRFRG
jgi:hypothetical protein